MCILMKGEESKQGGGGPERRETQEEGHTRMEAETGVAALGNTNKGTTTLKLERARQIPPLYRFQEYRPANP